MQKNWERVKDSMKNGMRKETKNGIKNEMKIEIKKEIKKEIKTIGLAVVIGLTLATSIAARSFVYSETTQADIARNVIRFHVLANSDAEEDQSLKEAVRDRVLDTFKEGLNASNSVAETRAYLTAHLEEIRACAEHTVRALGYDYAVSASVATDFFPTKTYGDVVFPPGEYEALRIVIGAGAGRNWWCVMFPPLCYVDATMRLPEDGKQQLKSNLSEDEYKLLTYHTQDDGVLTVKFKIVEWWQNRKQDVMSRTQTASAASAR